MTRGTQSSNIEALAGVYEAFNRRKTWRQAELARELDVRPERLRKMLEALQDNGWPLEREEEPPQVYWSVQRHWFGGGVLVPRGSIPKLLRLLAYVPDSPERSEVIRLFDGAQPDAAAVLEAIDPPRTVSQEEETNLRAMESAIRARTNLEVKYFSRHRGELEWRTISPQRVHLDDAFRIAAVCHRDDQLKWFRLDGVQAVRDGSSEDGYRGRSSEQVEAFLSESVDGYHVHGPKAVHSFVIRDPTARWARNLLRPPLVHQSAPEGIRVEAETAGLIQVARFVISLGGDVTDVSPALVEEVRRLARAALQSVGE